MAATATCSCICHTAIARCAVMHELWSLHLRGFSGSSHKTTQADHRLSCNLVHGTQLAYVLLAVKGFCDFSKVVSHRRPHSRSRAFEALSPGRGTPRVRYGVQTDGSGADSRKHLGAASVRTSFRYFLVFAANRPPFGHALISCSTSSSSDDSGISRSTPCPGLLAKGQQIASTTSF